MIIERSPHGYHTCTRGHRYLGTTAILKTEHPVELSTQSELNIQFEAVFNKVCPTERLLKLNSGDYHNPNTRLCWEMFCAGYNFHQKGPINE